jgi:uncharacterized membrane protein YccC
VYFSGLAAGIYSLMFIWVIVVAACAASRVGLLLQTAWILATYGAALIALEGASAGFSAITRFAVTGFALSVAGAAVSSLVEGRRAAEEGLHREIESRKQLQRELEHLANHDPLTGVANRRQLEQHLARTGSSLRCRTVSPARSESSAGNATKRLTSCFTPPIQRSMRRRPLVAVRSFRCAIPSA